MLFSIAQLYVYNIYLKCGPSLTLSLSGGSPEKKMLFSLVKFVMFFCPIVYTGRFLNYLNEEGFFFFFSRNCMLPLISLS